MQALPALTDRRRWDEREAECLTEMTRQSSLFYWNGPQTDKLRDAFREYSGLSYMMPCSSGTAALHIAMLAIGLKPGEEVITSPITDMGSVIGVLYQLGVPVFADLNENTYNLDPHAVEEAITSKTRAILAVHLAGNPAGIHQLREIADRHGLFLIEDAAQAWGAYSREKLVGTLGDLGCFSLNDFKHISCGDGGVVATASYELGCRLQLMGDKGYDREKGTRCPGMLAPNYRITEPQSAIARVQMTKVRAITERRHMSGERLRKALAGIPGLFPPHVEDGDLSSYWFFMFRIDPSVFEGGREGICQELESRGIEAAAGYLPMPLYRYPLFQNGSMFGGTWPVRDLGLTSMDYRDVVCPKAEHITETAIKLPLTENMTDEYIDLLAMHIRDACLRLRR